MASTVSRNWVDIANTAQGAADDLLPRLRMAEGVYVPGDQGLISDTTVWMERLRSLLGTVDATSAPEVDGVLPTDEVADIVTGLEDENEALRSQLAAKHREIERLRAGMSEDYAYWFDKATVLDRERADWKLWNEESEAQLAAAHDVIRRVKERVAFEHYTRTGVEVNEYGRGAREAYGLLLDIELAPKNDLERAVLEGSATATEAHDGE